MRCFHLDMTEPRVGCRTGVRPSRGVSESNLESCADSAVRHGVVGNISACHADARGSIPRDGGRFGVLAQSEACVLRKHEVLGSKPRYSNLEQTGVLAQSEACVLSKDEVLGSKPRYSTAQSVWSSWL